MAIIKALETLLSSGINLSFLFIDFNPGDEDDPDLRAYAVLDAAALKDVYQIGSDYVKSYAAVLHNTSGLKLRYLPEAEALSTLSGAIHLLTFTNYLEKCAAKLKREVLGHAIVALAGLPPNCFFQLLEAFFGYTETFTSSAASTVADTLLPSTTLDEPPSTSTQGPPPGMQIPSHLKPAMSATVFTSSSESEFYTSSKLSPESIT